MQVRVKDHKKPTLSQEQYKKTKIRAMFCDYSDRYSPCGYCGSAHNTMYVCPCGFYQTYNDEGDLVWSNE